MHQEASDPLEALLAPHPVPLDRREEVFENTLFALRKQRRLRRWTGVARMCSFYAAGLLTAFAFQPPPVEKPVAVVRTQPPADAPAAPANRLEWQALDDPGSAVGLYRRAADQYLAEDNPAEAVRCYGNSLDAGRAEDLEVSSDDSWLLMAIKHARKKERDE
jgi:hypothetical protein